MKKIKILFIDHTPFVGGAQICLANHIKYLDRKKFEPNLVIDKSSKFSSIYQDSKVKIFKIEMLPLKRLDLNVLNRVVSSVKQFNKLVDDLNPDIVLVNTTRALIIAMLAHKKFKLISYIRDYDYPKWLIKLAKFRVDKFLMVSKSIDTFYGNVGEVVYLGTDIYKRVQNSKSHTPASQTRVKMRKKFGITKKDMVIGYVGRLVDWKGADILVEAFKKLEQKNIKLFIFGSGKGQAGDIEDELKMAADERIIFPGFIETPLIYNLINFFVLPSKKPEPFATNVIEAAMSNLPIIATNIGGSPEFIKNNQNGLLVSPGDSESLAAALLKLIKDRKLAKRLANQAFKDAQIFREDLLARKLERIYASYVTT